MRNYLRVLIRHYETILGARHDGGWPPSSFILTADFRTLLERSVKWLDMSGPITLGDHLCSFSTSVSTRTSNSYFIFSKRSVRCLWDWGVVQTRPCYSQEGLMCVLHPLIHWASTSTSALKASVFYKMMQQCSSCVVWL